MERDPFFGLLVPQQVPGVHAQVLNPRGTWQDSRAYDEQARTLAGMFQDNFAQYKTDARPEVIAAGPRTDGSTTRVTAAKG